MPMLVTREMQEAWLEDDFPLLHLARLTSNFDVGQLLDEMGLVATTVYDDFGQARADGKKLFRLQKVSADDNQWQLHVIVRSGPQRGKVKEAYKLWRSSHAAVKDLSKLVWEDLIVVKGV